MVVLIIALAYVASAFIFYRWMVIKAVAQEEEPIYSGGSQHTEVNLEVQNNDFFEPKDREDKIA